MNAICQNRQKCQKPTLADEIELWKIPEDERTEALRYEFERERIRKEKQLSIPLGNPSPWLALGREEKNAILCFYRMDAGLVPPPAVEIANAREAHRRLDLPEGEKAIHSGKTWSDLGLGALNFQGDDGLIVGLKIDPAQGREAIRKGFAEILKQLDLPNGSGRLTQASKNLRSLAVYRAKMSQPSGNWMRYFKGTPYAGTEAAQKERIRQTLNKLGEG
jgi:hypothetical protein